MNNKVESIKVWTKNWNGRSGFDVETRIYIDMVDGRRGGYYLTGNPYQSAGDIDGQLTVDDVDAAKELVGSSWKTMYSEDVATAYKLKELCAEEEAEESEEMTEESEEMTEESEEAKEEPEEASDHSFFDDFFAEPEKKCCRCDSTKDLIVVSNDDMTYICRSCRDARKDRVYRDGSDPTEEAVRTSSYRNHRR